MNPNRFNYERKPAILLVEDLPGLEILMRPVSIGEILGMARLADEVRGGAATAEQVDSLFTLFAACTKSWNLDVDGEPVPATAEGLRSLDPDLFLRIFNAWFEGLTKAPKASTKPAENSGGPSLQDLPMAPLRAV